MELELHLSSFETIQHSICYCTTRASSGHFTSDTHRRFSSTLLVSGTASNFDVVGVTGDATKKTEVLFSLKGSSLTHFVRGDDAFVVQLRTLLLRTTGCVGPSTLPSRQCTTACKCTAPRKSKNQEWFGRRVITQESEYNFWTHLES